MQSPAGCAAQGPRSVRGGCATSAPKRAKRGDDCSSRGAARPAVGVLQLRHSSAGLRLALERPRLPPSRACLNIYLKKMRTALLQRGRGFTLIEVAVVLVILGCLMAGVLQAQELVQSARVRALIAQQSDIKAAYYA